MEITENKNELMSFDDFNKEEDKDKIVKKDVKRIDLDNSQTIKRAYITNQINIKMVHF